MECVTRAAIHAAQTRSVAVDELVAPLLAPLAASGSAVAMALGSYGRQELTPHAEIELLVVHTGHLQAQYVTEQVWYPLWDRKLRLEPGLKSFEQCVDESRHSLAATLRFFDARFVAGDKHLFDQL